MGKLSREIENVLVEQFGKDSIIALATAVDGIPSVRGVDAFYEDGALYVLTHGLPNSGRFRFVGLLLR